MATTNFLIELIKYQLEWKDNESYVHWYFNAIPGNEAGLTRTKGQTFGGQCLASASAGDFLGSRKEGLILSPMEHCQECNIWLALTQHLSSLFYCRAFHEHSIWMAHLDNGGDNWSSCPPINPCTYYLQAFGQSDISARLNWTTSLQAAMPGVQILRCHR